MQLWYVETSLYDKNGELLEEVGSLVVKADTELEAGKKAEKLSLQVYEDEVTDAEWGIAELIDPVEVQELIESIVGLIVEQGETYYVC